MGPRLHLLVGWPVLRVGFVGAGQPSAVDATALRRGRCTGLGWADQPDNPPSLTSRPPSEGFYSDACEDRRAGRHQAETAAHTPSRSRNPSWRSAAASAASTRPPARLRSRYGVERVVSAPNCAAANALSTSNAPATWTSCEMTPVATP